MASDLANMMEIQYIRTSTLLIKWDGMNILTDPWFAMHMRGLPVFVRPCIKAEGLPPLDLVLASHLHSDHYDRKAMSRLAQPCKLVIGPDGIQVGRDKVQAEKILTMADGDKYKGDGFTVHAYSVEHSGYENSYLVQRNGMSLYFAGDAKYCDAFKKIGAQTPPLVSLLPVGGTLVFGRRIVMNPEAAYQAALDLETKIVVPIHMGGEWMSVPPLSLHPGRSDKLVKLAEEKSAPFKVVALKPGQKTTVDYNGQVTGP